MSSSPNRLEISSPSPATLAVQGEIDAHSAPQFAESIAAAAVDADLTVDLSGVPFMDSSGLRVLIEAHQRISESGHRLVLGAPSVAVRRLLDVAGLNDLFPVAD